MSSPSIATSAHPFAETATRLKGAITSGGATLFAEIDQRAAAEGAGTELRPTTLLVFGNPKGGTPLMAAFPLVALDLPLKLLVWDDGGAVRVAYVPVAEIAARYGVAGFDELIGRLQQSVERLVATVT